MPNNLICERIPGDGNTSITIHDTASAKKKKVTRTSMGSASSYNIGYIKYNFIKAVAV